jgi:hypothetical protein
MFQERGVFERAKLAHPLHDALRVLQGFSPALLEKSVSVGRGNAL